MLRFHEVGKFGPDQIRAEWCQSSRLILPEIEAMIDRAWREATARPGIHLFDGPMCRMESFRVVDVGTLHLRLSRTSYKVFLGTNLTHPQFVERFGTDVMANPVGVSPALVTADDYLMLGRRNSSVAYYPNRLHPFAGALEPPAAHDAPPPSVFDEVRRELREELSMKASDIAEIYCTGIAEDLALRQAEMIFAARSNLKRSQIEAQVHDAEHHASWAVRATPGDVERALSGDEPFTPVARAALLLYGRIRFGVEWFNRLASAGH